MTYFPLFSVSCEAQSLEHFLVEDDGERPRCFANWFTDLWLPISAAYNKDWIEFFDDGATKIAVIDVRSASATLTHMCSVFLARLMSVDEGNTTEVAAGFIPSSPSVSFSRFLSHVAASTFVENNETFVTISHYSVASRDDDGLRSGCALCPCYMPKGAAVAYGTSSEPFAILRAACLRHVRERHVRQDHPIPKRVILAKGSSRYIDVKMPLAVYLQQLQYSIALRASSQDLFVLDGAAPALVLPPDARQKSRKRNPPSKARRGIDAGTLDGESDQ